jgi:hypothetical protein
METNLKISKPASSNKLSSPAIIFLVLLLAAGFLFYLSIKQASVPAPGTTLSQAALEEKYGLRVSLVAVTAAGGMVDLRLKMVDAEKARALLQDPNNFPALRTGSVILNPSEEVKSREFQFDDGGSLYLFYPNSGNAVKHGGTVSVLFGNTALEPIEVK